MCGWEAVRVPFSGEGRVKWKYSRLQVKALHLGALVILGQLTRDSHCAAMELEKTTCSPSLQPSPHLPLRDPSAHTTSRENVCTLKNPREEDVWSNSVPHALYTPPTPQEVLIQPLLQYMCVHVMLLQSCLTLCSSKDYSPQAPLSVVFSRQGYWSRLPCSPPGDLPDPGIKPVFLLSPALASKLFTTSPTWIPGLIRSWHSCGSFFQRWPTVSRKMRAETLLRTCWLEGKFGRTQEPRQLS